MKRPRLRAGEVWIVFSRSLLGRRHLLSGEPPGADEFFDIISYDDRPKKPSPLSGQVATTGHGGWKMLPARSLGTAQ